MDRERSLLQRSIELDHADQESVLRHDSFMKRLGYTKIYIITRQPIKESFVAKDFPPHDYLEVPEKYKKAVWIKDNIQDFMQFIKVNNLGISDFDNNILHQKGEGRISEIRAPFGPSSHMHDAKIGALWLDTETAQLYICTEEGPPSRWASLGDELSVTTATDNSP